MDPNQALYDLLLAMHQQDYETTEDAMRALMQWMQQDGFMPDVPRTLRRYLADQS